MILVVLIVVLMVGGLLSWLAGKWNSSISKWIAFITVVIDFFIVVMLWVQNPGSVSKIGENGGWIADFHTNWIPQIGASFHFALDGLSLVMTALTLFVGALATLTSWKEIKHKIGFYNFNLLYLLAGILGVFMSVDMLLFYFFWEVMLVPMFFLMSIWGFEKRKHASLKFFIYTQISGLLMLLAILGLYFVHGHISNSYTFNYFDLIGTSLSASLGFWLMCGFLIAFVVKLPAFVFHGWLPDAYTHSPTAGTIILAGLMTKTAAYGMLRFVLPLFPDAAQSITPLMMLLGVLGILYGAKLAYAQHDFKRLIAFSSLSHMGFIIIGIFSFQTIAYQGAVMEMVVHGISIAGLFVVAGALGERLGTRDMRQMGRFWEKVPGMGGLTMVFVLASLGLPGLGNFIAEFLVLVGVFQTSILWAVLGGIGLIGSMIYSLVILQKIFHGESHSVQSIKDFSAREYFVMGCLTVAIFWLGLFPQKVIDTVKPTIQNIEKQVNVKQVSLLNIHKQEDERC